MLGHELAMTFTFSCTHLCQVLIVICLQDTSPIAFDRAAVTVIISETPLSLAPQLDVNASKDAIDRSASDKHYFITWS